MRTPAIERMFLKKAVAQMALKPNQRTHKWIKELRVSKGYTQKAIAKKLGINHPTYVFLETGRSNPSIQTLDKVAANCGSVLTLVVRNRRRK